MKKKTNLAEDLVLDIISSLKPDNSEILNNRLLHLIKNHKLEGRINKDSFKNTHYLNKNFFSELSIAKFELQFIFEKHCQTIREMMVLFKSMGVKDYPIIIKGLSIYGLTKHEDNIKRSADIDVLHPDPSLLESILKILGFKREGDEKITEHEYCMMVKDKVVIEIHKYVPIVNYSDGMKDKAHNVSTNHNSVFFETFTKIETEKLLYEEIAKSAQKCDLLGGALIPDSGFQILILSAHLLRNYVGSGFHYSSGVIIGELLDIMDLLAHSSFESSNLNNILITDGRITSISFSNYLMKIIYGFEQLEPYVENPFYLFPRKLFWNGAMYLPEKSNEFIYCELNQTADNLKAFEVKLTQKEHKLALHNIQKYNSHGVEFIENIFLKQSLGQLKLSIEITNYPCVNTADVFELVFDDKRSCFSFGYNQILVTEELPSGYKLDSDLREKNYIISVFIPIQYKDAIHSGLIINVTRWGDGPLSTLIPIIIVAQ